MRTNVNECNFVFIFTTLQEVIIRSKKIKPVMFFEPLYGRFV